MQTHRPEEDEGQPIDNRLKDLDIMQDLFYSTPVSQRLGYLTNVFKYVDAMRTLRILCSSSASDPHDIAHEWRRVCAVLGDSITHELLSDPLEWQQLVYVSAAAVKPFRQHDDYTVVWKQPRASVIARCSPEGFLSFSVEQKEF